VYVCVCDIKKVGTVLHFTLVIEKRYKLALETMKKMISVVNFGAFHILNTDALYTLQLVCKKLLSVVYPNVCIALRIILKLLSLSH